jgi:hypothetical protein
MEGCVWSAENDAFQSAAWGDTAAMEWIEANLAFWPPAEAPRFSADSYPPDIQDQLRFRLTLYSAFAGRYSSAVQHLTALVSNPTISTTQWITPAQQFRTTYTSVEQLSKACQITQVCYPIISLPRLVELIPDDSVSPLETLHSFGVPIEASGQLNSQYDQEREVWLLAGNEADSYQTLWLLAQISGGWDTVRVGTIAGGQGDTHVELLPVQGKPVFKLFNAN